MFATCIASRSLTQRATGSTYATNAAGDEGFLTNLEIHLHATVLLC
jgi:hypothetical protein